MGIYIKGMEMPKNCEECAIKSWDMEDYVCPFSGISTLCISRQANCPLIPVPDHGRLIDADALEDYCHRQTKNKWNESTQTSWAYAYASFESDVEDAPTIIESEGE